MAKELFIEKDWYRDGEKFHHCQVFFDGSIYVYEVSYCGSKNHWYELFKRKLVNDVKNIDGKLIRSETDFHVKYPSNEDFGKWAFCCHDKESILRFLKDRNERLNDSSFNGLLNGSERLINRMLVR